MRHLRRSRRCWGNDARGESDKRDARPYVGFPERRRSPIQLGNAVPVELGRAIGISIQKHIEEYERKSDYGRERKK